MAGHNKWSKVKHRKAVVDSRRSKVWTKCVKLIMVAAKHGGPDPDMNLALRYAIDEARYANVPRETIERAIKKGVGELGGQNYENVRYEGYGPGGVAIVVDALTDNRTRTAGDVRNAFAKFGGNLGATGCVSFMFETRGEIAIAPAGVDADRLMELAADAGAKDVEPSTDDGPWLVITDPTDFARVKDAVEKAGLTIDSAAISLSPTNSVAVTGDTARSILKLIDTLEDSDDVQKVYANFEIPEAELADLG
ncbi:MAG: YebC/PmpR family DNA-binding transcriptional regulator [Phycisphaeraceae bacterium]|nr:YebC/PmpR family DNA-binding transcriptional regulator [Phycisphaeraceae bacterium]MBX3406235.1 YebC/PmpR family DNA-binding transcriptional regulator [Phycisphaeraceae bacterium]